MDESLISRIIHAAKAGKLTDEQYDIYLQLLDEDPEFEQQARWEQFLGKYLPASMDSEIYEAASKIKFPEKIKVVSMYNYYAVAAGVILVFISGWLVFEYGFKTEQPGLAVTAPIEYFNGDSIPNRQLGYAEGMLAVGEKTLKLWDKKEQEEQISYQFCNDTLQLYFRQISDTAGFVATHRLTYFSDTESYYLISKAGLPLKLSVCNDKPQPLSE